MNDAPDVGMLMLGTGRYDEDGMVALVDSYLDCWLHGGQDRCHDSPAVDLEMPYLEYDEMLFAKN